MAAEYGRPRWGRGNGATGVNLLEGLATTGEFGKDGIDRGSPNKRLRIFVPGGKELVDRSDKVSHAEERITANSFVGEFGEPAFNQVQPAAACGHIVDDKT